MNQDITKLFGNEAAEKKFNRIKITLAGPDKIKSWSYGEIKSQKLLITELSNLRGMAYSVQEFLDQLKIMNAYVENIKE